MASLLPPIYYTCRACLVHSKSRLMLPLSVAHFGDLFTECTTIQTPKDCRGPQMLCIICYQKFLPCKEIRSSLRDSERKIHDLFTMKHTDVIKFIFRDAECRGCLKAIEEGPTTAFTEDFAKTYAEYLSIEIPRSDFGPQVLCFNCHKQFMYCQTLRLSAIHADRKIGTSLGEVQEEEVEEEEVEEEEDELPTPSRGKRKAVKSKVNRRRKPANRPVCKDPLKFIVNLSPKSSTDESASVLKLLPDQKSFLLLSLDDPIPCPVCQSPFDTYSTFRKHFLDTHDPSKERLRKCSICLAPVIAKQSLLLHTLQEHMKDILVSVEEAPGCVACTQNFRTLEELNKHQGEQHTAFIHCPGCEFKTFHVQSMKAHFQEEHPNARMICHPCGFRFGDKFQVFTSHLVARHRVWGNREVEAPRRRLELLILEHLDVNEPMVERWLSTEIKKAKEPIVESSKDNKKGRDPSTSSNGSGGEVEFGDFEDLIQKNIVSKVR